MELTPGQQTVAWIGAAAASAGWLWRRVVGVIDGKATRAELETVNQSLGAVHDKLDGIAEKVGGLRERVAKLEGAQE